MSHFEHSCRGSVAILPYGYCIFSCRNARIKEDGTKPLFQLPLIYRDSNIGDNFFTLDKIQRIFSAFLLWRLDIRKHSYNASRFTVFSSTSDSAKKFSFWISWELPHVLHVCLEFIYALLLLLILLQGAYRRLKGLKLSSNLLLKCVTNNINPQRLVCLKVSFLLSILNQDSNFPS